MRVVNMPWVRVVYMLRACIRHARHVSMSWVAKDMRVHVGFTITAVLLLVCAVVAPAS